MTIGRTVSLALFAIFRSTDPPSPSYATTVAEVERAMVEVNTDPEHGIAALRLALAELHEHAPELAADPIALERRTLAELALARALLANGDHDAAAATVDATLESLADAALPIDQLGPSLAALVDERTRALAARGHAQLHVRCSVPCRVYVDEREATADDGVSLPLGEHRIWIAGDGQDPLRTTLTLTEPDAALTLAYPAVPLPTLVDPSSPSPTDAGEAAGLSRRVAPRWAAVTTTLIGTAALAAGAVLWAIDSDCPGGLDPSDTAACPELYDTRTAGIALVLAGTAATLTGGVLLVVDETRLGDRRGHELALTWTTRF